MFHIKNNVMCRHENIRNKEKLKKVRLSSHEPIALLDGIGIYIGVLIPKLASHPAVSKYLKNLTGLS